jgi:hypothetical protein
MGAAFTSDDARFEAVQSGVVGEMLESLATVTIPGQRHLMTKVIAILEGEMARRGAAAGGPSPLVAGRWLTELAEQASLEAPDVGTFSRCAETFLRSLRS